MSEVHDHLTVLASSSIMKKIRDQDATWKQIFSNSVSRVGDFGWPRPDYVCFDHALKQSMAFEFKPPKQTKREYLTGLGQSISYLQKHHYSGLIIPRRVENFAISEYINKVLEIGPLRGLPISLIDYDEDNIESDSDNSIRLLRPISALRADTITQISINQTYWAWWRDTSHYELLLLLELSDKYKDQPGDIYTNHIWPEFWKLMVEGKTKQWDGQPRSISGDPNIPDSSQKQNNKIPLFQLGLWEQGDGRLTLEGYKVLSYGRMWGADGAQFKDYLTYLILVNGNHLQLIRDVVEFQDNFATTGDKSSSSDFRNGVEDYLESKGAIGPRKPGRVTTDAKGSYLRDEPKLWNKLNLLKAHGTSYFIPGIGYKFDWNRITEILTKDFSF